MINCLALARQSISTSDGMGRLISLLGLLKVFSHTRPESGDVLTENVVASKSRAETLGGLQL